MKRISLPMMLLASVCAMPALAGQSHKRPIHNHHLAHSTVQVGAASWYGGRHAGRLTASGERFNPQAMTCAHRTLPLGSVVKVTDVATGKTVSLKVNDRGPYVRGRILDLSEGAAKELGVGHRGIMIVRIEAVSDVQPG